MTTPNDVAQRVASALAMERDVAAVVVTGSRAQGTALVDSDLDLFVYIDGPIGESRRRLAQEMADGSAPVLVDVDPFGSGDIWRAEDGTWVDALFWPTTWADDQLDRVLTRHEASLGYSTAFWRSIATAMPLYERDRWHPDLQQRAAEPYPDALVESVLALNMPWLSGHPFSFLRQIEKAVARADTVSLNHRLAAWLASYFDVLFAVNRVLHPGEKRLLEYAQSECSRLPDGFPADIGAVVAAEDPVETLRSMVAQLSAVAAE